MPPKRSRYEVDEYVPVATTPTVDSRPITRQHTQYEMRDASRTSRVKTVLNIEHEELPIILTDTALTEDVDIPDLVPMHDEDLSDEEGPADDGQGDSGFDNDIAHELEAAGLGNIRAPKPVKSRRVRNTHTVILPFFICQFHSY